MWGWSRIDYSEDKTIKLEMKYKYDVNYRVSRTRKVQWCIHTARRGEEVQGFRLGLISAKRGFSKSKLKKINVDSKVKTMGDSNIILGSKIMLISAGNSTGPTRGQGLN